MDLEVEAYLSELREISDLIKTVKRELKESEFEKAGKGISTDNTPVQTSGGGDPTGLMAVKTVTLENKLLKLKYKLAFMKEERLSLIARIQPYKYQNILILYYYRNYSLGKIAKELKKSYPTVQKWHKEALEIAEKIYQEEKEKGNESK